MKLKTIGILLMIIGGFTVLAGGALWWSNEVDEQAASDFSADIVNVFWEQTGRFNSATANSEGLTETVESPEIIDPDGSEEFSTIGEEAFMPYLIIDDVAYIGILAIPALELTLPVNAFLTDEALLKTPCRYSGTIARNSLVIAAHNYRRQFGGLSRLAVGSNVTFVDPLGNNYLYQVALVERVEPNSVTYVTNSNYDLTLFTCTYGGQARVVMRCMRVE
jgi:sortase A